MALDTEYKIIGLDSERPPRIQRMPCIDLYFELNEEPDPGWCNEFLAAAGKTRYPVKVDESNSLFVFTWVRQASEIPVAFELAKSVVDKCNKSYRETLIRQKAIVAVDDPVAVISPEQQALNKIVAGLAFDE